jgi:uncharacterized phage infection (PIP) family protein YhgE
LQKIKVSSTRDDAVPNQDSNESDQWWSLANMIIYSFIFFYCKICHEQMMIAHLIRYICIYFSILFSTLLKLLLIDYSESFMCLFVISNLLVCFSSETFLSWNCMSIVFCILSLCEIGGKLIKIFLNFLLTGNLKANPILRFFEFRNNRW